MLGSSFSKEGKQDEIHKIPSAPNPTLMSNFMYNASDDLLVAVLVRLPNCRSAIQCCAVCKRWNSLISSSQFIRSFTHHRHQFARPDSLPYTFVYQTSRLNRNTLLVEYDSEYCQLFSEKSEILHRKSAASVSSDYLNFLPGPMFIAASCNDLLLLSPSPESRYYFICNPLTRNWLALPKAPIQVVAPSAIGLACEPNSCNKQIGCTNNAEYTYKVVRFYYHVSPIHKKVRIKAMIFSSKTQKWIGSVVSLEQQQIDSFRVVAPRTDGVVSHDGVLYWIDQYWTQCVIAFHPFKATGDEKRWRFISLPVEEVSPEIVSRWSSTCGHCLGVWRDRLRVAKVVKTDTAWNEIFLRVWELRDYKKDDATAAAVSWSLIHKARFRSKGRNYPFANFHPNNPDVVFLYCSNTSVRQYNILKKELVTVGEFPRSFSTAEEFSVFSLKHPSWPTPISRLSSVS